MATKTKAIEYTGIKFSDPYYIFVDTGHGDWRLHDSANSFQEAYAKHQGAIALYVVDESKVQIVKRVDWQVKEVKEKEWQR